jgi:hypothetical protein
MRYVISFFHTALLMLLIPLAAIGLVVAERVVARIVTAL